jgi:hypothetical protein
MIPFEFSLRIAQAMGLIVYTVVGKPVVSHGRSGQSKPIEANRSQSKPIAF